MRLTHWTALVAVLAAAGTAASATATNAARDWRRCATIFDRGPLAACDGRGNRIFPFFEEFAGEGGRSQHVVGVRRTGPGGTGIVDVRASWYGIFGECGQNGPPISDCGSTSVTERIRFWTGDGGRHWTPLRFHRKVHHSEGPGPGPPVLTWSFEDNPPLRPCKWVHVEYYRLAEGIGPGFGNWCAPPNQWGLG